MSYRIRKKKDEFAAVSAGTFRVSLEMKPDTEKITPYFSKDNSNAAAWKRVIKERKVMGNESLPMP